MATIPIQPAEVAKTTTGGPPFKWTLPEAASQSFKVGAIISLDGSGNVIEMSSAANDRILGISAVTGSNKASANLVDTLFYVADDSTIFVMNANTATARNMVGQSYTVAKDGTTANYTVDTNSGVQTAANRVVQVIGLDPRDVVGDTNGRLLVMFNAQCRGLTFTS